MQVFNSITVSGPEKLVIPALAESKLNFKIINLYETRRAQWIKENFGAAAFAKSFSLDSLDIAVHSRYDRIAIESFAREIDLFKPNIIHSHDVKASYYALKAKEMAQHKNYKMISTHHGVRARYGWKVKLYELYYFHFILSKFDLVLSVCSSDRDILISRGMPKNKVEVHLNGVDRKNVDWADRSTLATNIRDDWHTKQLIPSKDQFTIGVIARLSNGKSHLDIIKLAGLMRDHSDISFLFFGNGELKEALNKMITDLDLKNTVKLCGFDNSISEKLHGFDLILSLSLAEGLPINLIEAGWSSTPVLSTAIDGVLDLISNNESGVLVPVDFELRDVKSKIFNIKNSPDFSRTIATGLNKRVKSSFNQKNWLSRLEELYSK
jgi:glycosyltransferase involved in cell wall biosynthesis